MNRQFSPFIIEGCNLTSSKLLNLSVSRAPKGERLIFLIKYSSDWSFSCGVITCLLYAELHIGQSVSSRQSSKMESSFELCVFGHFWNFTMKAGAKCVRLNKKNKFLRVSVPHFARFLEKLITVFVLLGNHANRVISPLLTPSHMSA